VDSQDAFLECVAMRMANPEEALLRLLLEAKAAASEAAIQVTDLGMRTGGGAAFGKQLTVERNFRDARACAVMAPTTDALYDFVARVLLEMPLF